MSVYQVPRPRFEPGTFRYHDTNLLDREVEVIWTIMHLEQNTP